MLEISKFEVWNNWLCRNKRERELELHVYIAIVCENLYYIGVGNSSLTCSSLCWTGKKCLNHHSSKKKPQTFISLRINLLIFINFYYIVLFWRRFILYFLAYIEWRHFNLLMRHISTWCQRKRATTSINLTLRIFGLRSLTFLCKSLSCQWVFFSGFLRPRFWIN